VRAAYKVLLDTFEGKRPLGKPRFRSKNNIKIYFKEIGWKHVHWTHLVQDRDRT
jgi:hypothetical protein